MTDASNDKRDFFVSFTQDDRPWAAWIVGVLRVEGYSLWFQDDDFKGNFVAYMEQAHAHSERTLVVLSDNYLRSDFTLAEWSPRLARDAAGREDRLVAVRVGPVSQPSLLDPYIRADLFEADELTARQRLLERVRLAAGKPKGPEAQAAPFPGGPKSKRQDASLGKAPFPVPVHNDLPPYNPNFVGREDLLADLRQTLGQEGNAASTQMEAVTGLGGIGKTQLALAYVYRHLAAYWLVWWVRAEEPTTRRADLVALAPHLELDPKGIDEEALLAAIRRELARRPGWLLVFDNAPGPADIRDLVPRTGGHTIVTSRHRHGWEGTARELEMPVLPEDEAVALLLGESEAEPQRRAEARALAEQLGFLPLALAQARAYVNETGIGFAEYGRDLEKDAARAFEEAPLPPDYPRSVALTWHASLTAAEQTCAPARMLLELLSFLAPDPVPRDLFKAKLDGAPEVARPSLLGRLWRNLLPWRSTSPMSGLSDPRVLDKAIAALGRFSLITVAPGRLAAHRLVQVITRAGLDAATAKTRAEAAIWLVDAALPRPPEEHTNWPAMGLLLPHALAAAEAAERLGADLETAAVVLNETALYYQARAAWAEALPLYQRAIAIGEQTLGPEHPELAARLNNLAILYRDTGRYAEAEPLYQRAIAIGEQTLGPEHPNLAAALNNLAELYRATGRYAEAEPLYQRAMATDEKALGPEHPNLARDLNNLALLYQATGRYAEAEPLYVRAIAIGEKALGPEHPNLATALNNLADLYLGTGRYAEAEPLYVRAIAIGEKALGPEHPNLAIALNNLADLYLGTGRYAEAEPLYVRAIAAGLNNLAELYRAAGLNNLALLYWTTGRYAEAEPLYGHALTILEKALPADHPNLAVIRTNYARLLDQLGRGEEAAALRAQAAATRPSPSPHEGGRTK
jgi:tetratricopeptide (TPR) repeat protein